MIDGLIYILKIFYYFFFVFMLYSIALHYKNDKKEKKKIYNQSKKKYIIPITCIILLSLIFGYYSIICGRYPYVSDRLNYAFRFLDDIYLPAVKNESLGLYWIELFLHLFTYEPKVLFFTIAFLYVLLTLIAYNMYDDAEPFSLLLLGLSAYFSFGCYLFKQCIAIALIALSIAMYEKNKKVISIILIILAICFHEAAWIVVPVYFALYFSKSKKIRIIEYLIITICAIFFRQINQVMISAITNIIPNMSYQLSLYLNDSGGMNLDINLLTAFKGVPFYFITIFGYLKKNELEHKIKNYDKYMFLCFFVSITTFLSTYMYWMYRFATFFYFPVFIFASRIFHELENKREKILFFEGTVLLLFVLTLRLWIQYYFKYGGL